MKQGFKGNMKTVILFPIRNSLWIAALLFVFAAVLGVDVCVGLWQGGGLHGYSNRHSGRYNFDYKVSTWASFVGMREFAAVGGLFACVYLGYLWSERRDA